VTAWGDGKILIWDLETGRTVKEMSSHDTRVSEIAYCREMRLLASGSFHGTVRVWDADTWSEVAFLRGHGEGVWRLAFSANWELLLAGYGDGVVRVWDTSAWTESACFESHASSDSIGTLTVDEEAGTILVRAGGRAWGWSAKTFQSVDPVCRCGQDRLADVAESGAAYRLTRRAGEGAVTRIGSEEAVAWIPLEQWSMLKPTPWDGVWVTNGYFSGALVFVKLEGADGSEAVATS